MYYNENQYSRGCVEDNNKYITTIEFIIAKSVNTGFEKLIIQGAFLFKYY